MPPCLSPGWCPRGRRALRGQLASHCCNVCLSVSTAARKPGSVSAVRQVYVRIHPSPASREPGLQEGVETSAPAQGAHSLCLCGQDVCVEGAGPSEGRASAGDTGPCGVATCSDGQESVQLRLIPGSGQSFVASEGTHMS